MPGDIEWARQARLELLDEIRIVTARARRGSQSTEAIGLVPELDHLQDLKQRLAQVERLIEAMREAEPSLQTGWPADLGDPSATEEEETDKVWRPS